MFYERMSLGTPFICHSGRKQRIQTESRNPISYRLSPAFVSFSTYTRHSPMQQWRHRVPRLGMVTFLSKGKPFSLIKAAYVSTREKRGNKHGKDEKDVDFRNHDAEVLRLQHVSTPGLGYSRRHCMTLPTCTVQTYVSNTRPDAIDSHAFHEP